MDTLLQDLSYAVRTLLRSRGFTAAAVLCLALGVGVNTAVFSMVNALLLRPFPFHEPDRVVTLYATNPRSGIEEGSVSHADVDDWRRAGRTLIEDVAVFYGRNVAVAGAEEAERVEGQAASPNLFTVLGVRPALGRGFLPEEGRPGAEPVVVLSHGLWTRRFGADPEVLGRKVALNGRPVQVVGVMPERFGFPETTELWTPLVPDPAESRGSRYLGTVARLRPGVTVERAHAELAAAGRRLAAEHPETNAGWGAMVKSYRDDMVDGDLRLMMYLMLGAVGFVLLIACANVANLLLARTAARGREIAVRTALGAGRRRIVRQLLTESLLLSLAGAVLGVGIAAWWVDWTISRIPEQLPFWLDFGIDGRVLLFTLLLAAGTGVLFGLLPALRATGGDLQAVMRDGARGTGGAARSRLRGALVVGQMAMAMMLLVGATLMIRSFVQASRADLGFDGTRVLTGRLYLAGERYAGGAARVLYLEEATRRAAALPGVRAAAVTTAIPGTQPDTRVGVVAEGQPRARGEELDVTLIAGTDRLFGALGVPLVAGRGWTPAESADTAATTVVVNQELARRLWPGQDPTGRRVRLPGVDTAAWFTVAGVVRDLRYGEVADQAPQDRLQLYLPVARLGWRSVALVVRTEGDPAAVAGAVRRELRALDSTLPTYDVRTMAEVQRQATWPQRLWASLFGSFGALAILLAAVGVYGVMAYAVSQRVREIGIRIALGAGRGEVLRQVLREGAVLAGAGTVLGLLGALGVSRLMRGLLYGVAPLDPVAFVGIPLLLAGVALLAAYLPARRAAGVDPMVALRAE